MRLCAVDEQWQLQYATDRAGEILGISDVSDLFGKPFFNVFTPRDSSPQELCNRLALQLLEGSDFTVEAKAFSDEGRKVWVTCSFRSGTMSQVRCYQQSAVHLGCDIDVSTPGVLCLLLLVLTRGTFALSILVPTCFHAMRLSECLCTSTRPQLRHRASASTPPLCANKQDTTHRCLQLDDEMPVVAVPMDLPSEASTKSGYWFVSLSITDTNVRRGGATAAAAARFSPADTFGGANSAPPPLPPPPRGSLDNLIASAGDVFSVDALQNVTVSAPLARGLQSFTHHALLPGGEHALVEAIVGVDPTQAAAEADAAAEAWRSAGGQDARAADIEQSERAARALMLVRRAPVRAAQPLRLAIHAGVRF